MRAAVILLCGRSGAGKTTIAERAKECFEVRGRRLLILDENIIRQGLSSDLGFSTEDHVEQQRRLGFVAELFSTGGIAVIVASIAPMAAARKAFFAGCPTARLAHVDAPLRVCKGRDAKGSLAKGLVRADIPFQEPSRSAVDVYLPTDVGLTVSELAMKVVRAMARSETPLLWLTEPGIYR